MPALFTITCSAPNRSWACSMAACTLPGSDTSVWTNAAPSPSADTASLPLASSMSATSTRAPSSTNTSAIARPMPLAAPVTMAALPASSTPMICAPFWFCPLGARLADAIDHRGTRVDGERLLPDLDGIGHERQGVEELQQPLGIGGEVVQ